MKDIAIILQSVFELNMARVDGLIDSYKCYDEKDGNHVKESKLNVIHALTLCKQGMVNDHLYILNRIKGA